MQVMQPIEARTTMQKISGSTTPSREEAMILAAQKDLQLFSALYEKYYGQILKFVYQRVTTKEDAYDITQQIFLQAMLSLHKYEIRGFPFSSWLYRIALNEMNQLFRKNKKQRGINLEEKHLKTIVEELGEPGDEERENAILAVLTNLQEEEFQLVEMRFFEARPFKEIAEILNISEANAKMRLYRILEKIKPMAEKTLKKRQ
jgi:RNA polymerase sigma-70 factor (ECF subfamily)